jgi:3-hydroxyisobutyrate dehydrogenase
MGHPMLRRLARHGHAMHLHDIDGDGLASIAGEVAGAQHGSASGVAAAAELVITCLPSADAVEDVYWGRDGIRTTGHAPLTVDMSTVPPDLARRKAQGLARHDASAVATSVRRRAMAASPAAGARA